LRKPLFKRILVGFAFSPNLKANLFTSLRLASSLGANLFFVHVGKKTPVKEKTIEEILKDSPVHPKFTKVLLSILSQCMSLDFRISFLPTTGTLFSAWHAMTQAPQPVQAFRSIDKLK
jgi:hypothetical protein